MKTKNTKTLRTLRSKFAQHLTKAADATVSITGLLDEWDNAYRATMAAHEAENSNATVIAAKAKRDALNAATRAKYIKLVRAADAVCDAARSAAGRKAVAAYKAADLAYYAAKAKALRN